MDISNEQIFLVKGGDIPVSRIAKFFSPHEMDEGFAKVFLHESLAISHGGFLAGEDEKVVKEVIAICTVSKGETLEEVSEAISRKGWQHATLGDWYRYHISHPFSDGEAVATLGTTYLDENYREWVPVVSPWRNTSLFQKITKGEPKIIAKVLLRIKGNKAMFQSRKQFLVSRVLKEEDDPLPEKSK